MTIKPAAVKSRARINLTGRNMNNDKICTATSILILENKNILLTFLNTEDAGQPAEILGGILLTPDSAEGLKRILTENLT